MRFLIQRTRSAAVHIDGIAVAESHGLGMLILIGISPDDTAEDIEYLVKKTTQLRIFDDEDGVMNRSILDVGGDIIAVSQFTLMAETKKGNRPSYIRAARPEIAEPLYREVIRTLEERLGRPIGTGRFGADMQVSLTNDGPVTIWIDSKAFHVEHSLLTTHHYTTPPYDPERATPSRAILLRHRPQDPRGATASTRPHPAL